MDCIIKICGLTRGEDAAFCAEAGADWLGFIFHPQSPRHIAPEAAAEIDTGRAKRVGVFVNQSPDEIEAAMRAAKLDLAQLHGAQSANFCRAVGPARVVKTLWPQAYENASDLERERESFAEAAAYFLYDAGKSGGGHGRPFSPELLGGHSPLPFLIAGGLTAERAQSLMETGLPAGWAGFDFNSGVEQSPGLKDKSLVRNAITTLRRFR